jgi:hypothetical protein
MAKGLQIGAFRSRRSGILGNWPRTAPRMGISRHFLVVGNRPLQGFSKSGPTREPCSSAAPQSSCGSPTAARPGAPNPGRGRHRRGHDTIRAPRVRSQASCAGLHRGPGGRRHPRGDSPTASAADGAPNHARLVLVCTRPRPIGRWPIPSNAGARLEVDRAAAQEAHRARSTLWSFAICWPDLARARPTTMSSTPRARNARSHPSGAPRSSRT